MIEIWGRASSSNVQKVLWCCEELGLNYRRHDVGREFGGNRTLEYLQMNPNGLVPTISDEGLVIWESNAIQRYLSARYGNGALYPTELGSRSLVDRWLDWEVGTLAPTIHPVFWGLIRTPLEERDDIAIGSAQARLAEVLQVLDGHLSSRPYVAGDTLTLADISMGIPPTDGSRSPLRGRICRISRLGTLGSPSVRAFKSIFSSHWSR